MTKESLAAILNGRSCGDEITQEEEAQANSAGLVVIYGASDDLVEFRGAINDEIGAYDGTLFHLTRKGALEKHRNCECQFCGYEQAINGALKIQALWSSAGAYSWEFITSAPHATFEIIDEGEKYCRGIVLHLDDIQPL